MANAFAAIGPYSSAGLAGTRVVCEFKTNSNDSGQKLQFSLPAPGYEELLPAELIQGDLMGLDRPSSVKISIRQTPLFQDAPAAHGQAVSVHDEYVALKVGGLFTAPPKNEALEPRTFRFSGRLQIALARPKESRPQWTVRDSRLQWTVEEGVVGFMGIFEPRRTSSTDWVAATCQMKL